MALGHHPRRRRLRRMESWLARLAIWWIEKRSARLGLARPPMRLELKSGRGRISPGGVYKPPRNVTHDETVEISLLLDGTEVDTATFTVTPPRASV